MSVDLTLQQTGSKLTGAVVGLTGTAFDLTQGTVSGNNVTFAGTLKISSGSGKCTPATFTSSMTFDVSANTMTGTAAGTNEDCIVEDNALTFKKK